MPASIIVCQGDRYGLLTAVCEVEKKRNGHRRFRFKCDCGNYPEIDLTSVRSGGVVSCGCWNQLQRISRARHGDCRGGKFSSEYGSWHSMHQRCSNPKAPGWEWYGGRGIIVCERWGNYDNFLEDMGRKPTPEHSIDRHPNPDGNYEKDNCRWATDEQQSKNKINSIFVEYRGDKRPMIDVCKELGLSYDTVFARRFTMKWPEERWFIPVKPRKSKGCPTLASPEVS